MALYEVTGPDGSTYEVEAPDNADQGQILSFVKSEFDKQAKAKRKADASAYAGDFAPDGDVSKMGAVMRGLGGAKHSWDRAAYGLKGLFTDLSPEEQKQLEQGKAFVDEAGTAAGVGEFGGDVLTTAAPALRGMQAVRAVGRALPRAMGGAVVANPLVAAGTAGAAVGAATNPMDRSGGAVRGGVGGVAGEAGGRVLTRALGGVASRGVTPEARQLMGEGVDVPLWKGTGNATVRNVAERLKAFPVVGDAMKRQERRAIEQFNERLIREASPPVPVLDEAGAVLRWESQPVRGSGQEAMRRLHTNFENAYDTLYQGRTIPLDDVFTRELDTIASQTQAYLPGAAPTVLGAIRRANDTLRAGTETTRRASAILDESGRPIVTEQLGHAGVSNANVKRALEEIDESISTAWRRGDEEAASALEGVREAIQNVRSRGLPPEVSSMRAEIDSAYSAYKRLQRAASSVGAMRQGGVVTPAQMTNAVRAADRSPGKSLTARGMAPGQQQAQRAHEVLGSELPEVGPGTAEKLMLATGFGLGWVPAAALGGLALGTRQGQRFLQGGYGVQQLARDNPELLAHLLRTAGVAGNAPP